MNQEPKWTVVSNVVSPENNKRWVGTSWEFFDEEKEAQACYRRNTGLGNSSTVRPFHLKTDLPHMGAAHRKLGKLNTHPPTHDPEKSYVNETNINTPPPVIPVSAKVKNVKPEPGLMAFYARVNSLDEEVF